MHDIIDTAVAAGTFNTLAAAVTAAGLVPTLKGEGPFTVFAPSDAAFAKLPAGTVEALLADLPKLTAILTYHVVAGKVMAADVVTPNGQHVKTATGPDIAIGPNGGGQVPAVRGRLPVSAGGMDSDCGRRALPLSSARGSCGSNSQLRCESRLLGLDWRHKRPCSENFTRAHPHCAVVP